MVIISSSIFCSNYFTLILCILFYYAKIHNTRKEPETATKMPITNSIFETKFICIRYIFEMLYVWTVVRINIRTFTGKKCTFKRKLYYKPFFFLYFFTTFLCCFILSPFISTENKTFRYLFIYIITISIQIWTRITCVYWHKIYEKLLFLRG